MVLEGEYGMSNSIDHSLNSEIDHQTRAKKCVSISGMEGNERQSAISFSGQSTWVSWEFLRPYTALTKVLEILAD